MVQREQLCGNRRRSGSSPVKLTFLVFVMPEAYRDEVRWPVMPLQGCMGFSCSPGAAGTPPLPAVPSGSEPLGEVPCCPVTVLGVGGCAGSRAWLA